MKKKKKKKKRESGGGEWGKHTETKDGDDSSRK